MNVPSTTSPLTRPELPPEVSLIEAAHLLGVDKKTVIKYIRGGLLEWRNIAPPTSSRPTFRIKLDSVVNLRTHYSTGMVRGPLPRPSRQRRVTPQRYDSRYVTIVRS